MRIIYIDIPARCQERWSGLKSQQFPRNVSFSVGIRTRRVPSARRPFS